MTTEDTKAQKAFPGFKDRNEYLKHPDIEDIVVGTLNLNTTAPNYADLLDTYQDELKGLRHRQKAGYNDPYSVIIVVNAMIQSYPKAYLRSLQMSLWLNKAFPQFIWEAVTVGRIMAEIVDVAYDTFGVTPSPVDRGTDWRGHYMVVDPEEGYTGRLWLMKLRGRLFKKVIDTQKLENDGTIPTRVESVWADVDTSND